MNEIPHSMHYGILPLSDGGFEVIVRVTCTHRCVVLPGANLTARQALISLRMQMAQTLNCGEERINFITPDGFCTNKPPATLLAQ